MNLKQFLSLTFLCLVLSACDLSSTFEDDLDFENGIWHMDSIARFDFDGKMGAQDVEIKFRSSLEYPIYNLYVKMTLTDSNGVALADELLSYDLYDAKTGKPLGKGNSIYQYMATVLSAYEFPYEGPYTINIAQYMRYVELPGILSVGVRVADPQD